MVHFQLLGAMRVFFTGADGVDTHALAPCEPPDLVHAVACDVAERARIDVGIEIPVGRPVAQFVGMGGNQADDFPEFSCQNSFPQRNEGWVTARRVEHSQADVVGPD